MATGSTRSWEDHAAAIQSGKDQSAAEEAMCALQPLVEQTAQRVCRCRMVSKQIREDFVAGAAAFVWHGLEMGKDSVRRPPIASYDPSRGRFPAWLWTVLDRCLIDFLRSEAPRRNNCGRTITVEEGDSDPILNEPSPAPPDPADEMDRTSPFMSDSDIDRIKNWPILDRILVLVVLGLWRKIPRDLWCEWCKEAGFSAPFPQNEEEHLTRGEWINIIAELLSSTRNALQNRLRRRLKKLKVNPLDCIRERFNDE